MAPDHYESVNRQSIECCIREYPLNFFLAISRARNSSTFLLLGYEVNEKRLIKRRIPKQ